MNIFASDPIIGFTYKPHAKTYEKGREYNALYLINNLGLRDREYGHKKNGEFRILLLGDSFSVSHGIPIENSLSRQLERSMQSVADSDGMNITIEVINAAVGGYSPYNYWRAYSRWAPVFKPDAVIVALSPDDYDCSNEYARYLIENGETLAMTRNSQEPKRDGNNYIKSLRKWLSWNSQFYILIRNYFYYNDLVGSISLWLDAKGEAQASQLQQYLINSTKSTDKTWDKTFSYLQSLRKEAAAEGVKLIVVSIPLKLEIDSKEYQRALAANGLKHQQVDPAQPLRSISTLCKSEHIPVLDPRSAIRERHAELPCYFVYDGHWNTEGIRVAAASLARQWRGLGLPPWDSPIVKAEHH